MSTKRSTSEAELETLQRESFNYFVHEANSANGLIVDKTKANWPASIAATGLALAAYPVGVERGYMRRSSAVERTLTTLRFFWNPAGTGAGRHWLSGILLSLSRYADGPASLELRSVDGR